MGFEFLCQENDVATGTMKGFEINGEKVILFHLNDGFFATQAKCTHLFMPLEKGAIIEDCRIQCKFHRAEFDIKTGQPEKWANFPPGIQALNFIRHEKALQTYAIQVSEGKVSIDISQDASASANNTKQQTSDTKHTEDEPT